MASNFEGFPREFFSFYRQLEKNNDRDWFNENKQRYLDYVVAPSLEFITAMQPALKKISPCFLAVPKRTGGSLMRIYRDIRFSKNKLPYKTNLGIQFRHEMGKDVHAPGFYFHFSQKESFIGAGVWCPGSGPLNQIRAIIDDEAQKWKRVSRSKKFTSIYELAGSSLKRPPRGYDADHKLIDDLKRKDHIAVSPLSAKDLASPEIVDLTAQRIRVAMPYVRFLCDALRLPS